MQSDLLKKADREMEKSVDAVRREFSTVRTGKATPALLDTVRVEAYGSTMPINQVANVSAPEPNLLVIQPYDQNVAEDIARSVRKADLGLNPSVDGEIIRVPVPPLSEERRKEMVKLLNRMGEEGRIAVRHVRQNVKSELQKLEKDGEISEDRYHRELDQLQETTDRHVETIDQLLQRKEKEIMEV